MPETDKSPITTWTRLEPRCRSADRDRWASVLAEQLETRIHDPLWLLTRQWQVGEFQGEDTGTPIHAEITLTRTPLIGLRAPGAQQIHPLQDAKGYALPIEALVESEPPAETNLELAAEAGLHLIRLLDAGLHGSDRQRLPVYRSTYTDPQKGFALQGPDPATIDADSASYLSVMAGRVPDGRQLARTPSAGLLTAAGFDPSLQPDLAIHEAWRASAPVATLNAACQADCWNQQRLEYQFDVLTGTAPGTICLTAPEYDGDLDWHSFDASRLTASTGQLPCPASQPPTVTTHRPLLAELTYAGMPNRRFWAFEDADVDFGSILAAPGDLARVLVARFATDTSNDWYLLPLTVPVGSLYNVEIVIHTVFGDTKSICPYAGQDSTGLRLFQLSREEGAPAAGLLLPPIFAADNMRSEPLEEIRIQRDEIANSAIAVEGIVETPAGSTRRRDEEPPRTSPSAVNLPAYRLRRDPPRHWLILSRQDASSLLPLLTVYGTPEGQLLKDGQQIAEEEIRYEGLTLTRTWQRARWTDGRTYTWIARRKTPSARNIASGIRFDYLEEPAMHADTEAG